MEKISFEKNINKVLNFMNWSDRTIVECLEGSEN